MKIQTIIEIRSLRWIFTARTEEITEPVAVEPQPAGSTSVLERAAVFDHRPSRDTRAPIFGFQRRNQ